MKSHQTSLLAHSSYHCYLATNQHSIKIIIASYELSTYQPERIINFSPSSHISTSSSRHYASGLLLHINLVCLVLSLPPSLPTRSLPLPLCSEEYDVIGPSIQTTSWNSPFWASHSLLDVVLAKSEQSTSEGLTDKSILPSHASDYLFIIAERSVPVMIPLAHIVRIKRAGSSVKSNKCVFETRGEVIG